jgi:hypothetical protein
MQMKTRLEDNNILTLHEVAKSFIVSWEKVYDYPQSMQVADVIYLLRKVCCDDVGKIGCVEMKIQMSQA